MKIIVLAEGDTERAAKSHLKRFLDQRADERPRVGLVVKPVDGPLTKRDVSVRTSNYLQDSEVLGVIALTDVCPEYRSAAEAKRKLRGWMPRDPRCHVHAAQFQFGSWLLCDWDAILRRAGISRQPFGGNPEQVDGNNQPADRLAELFRRGGKNYSKPIDGKFLFEQLDLSKAARQCHELKAFLNTMLSLAGYDVLGR